MVPQTSNAEDIDLRTSWNSTDEYKYPVPKPQGDHWDIILERFLMKDKLQCDAWKDEVQNLLLFAGLFSAVVTAFAVESYKTLQPDPNDIMTALLARIAVGVDTLSNNSDRSITWTTGNTPFPTSFSPTPTSVHINIFWFSSLILSLATVIVGIVSLQWLREHQRYSEPLNSKHFLAVFHLRSAALIKWAIPRIFTTLPLILQAAVILFFIGLVEFLFVLSPAVAVPAIVLISLPILFLIATTILPTLQLLFASFRLSSDFSIPVQCAYKSPQSWAFLHLSLLGLQLLRLFRQVLRHIPYPNFILSSLETICSNISDAWRNLFPKSAFCVITLPWSFKVAFNHRSWVDFDIAWLTLRDAHYLSQEKLIVRMDDNIRPSYDLIQALVSSAKEHAIHEQVVFAAYHGMKELCDAIVADDMLGLDSENSNLSSIRLARVTALQSGFSPFRSQLLQGKAFGLYIMRDEMMLAFLRLPGICSHSSNPAHPTGRHRMELFTRLLVCNRFRGVGHERKEIDPAHPFLAEINHVESAWEKPDAFPEDMMKQQYLTLERIFDLALDPSSYEVITNARYSMLVKYFDYIASFRCPENLEPNFLSVISTISRGLAFSPESQKYENANFLFFYARLYLENLARHLWFSDLMKFGPYKIRRNIIKLLETMLRYEHQLDRLTYCKMTRSWETVLPASNNSSDINYVATMFNQFAYEPIPETLLRFVPYLSKAHVQAHGHFEVVAVFPDRIDLEDMDGASMSFVQPVDDAW